VDATQRAEARTQAKERMKSDQDRQERSIARAGAREEIAALRAELAEMSAEFESLKRTFRTFVDAMDAITDTFATLADQRQEQRREIADLKTEITKLGATADQLVVRGKQHDVMDLPNPGTAK